MKNITLLRITDFSTQNIKELLKNVTSDYVIFVLSNANIIPFDNDFNQFILLSDIYNADVCYSDYILTNKENQTRIYLSTWQQGSIRNDFDFGFCVNFKTSTAQKAAEMLPQNIKKAGFYALWLQIAALNGIIKHIPQPLYKISADVDNNFETSNFAYVNPQNRDFQIEAEQVFTNYLKQIGAYLPQRTQKVENFNQRLKEFKNLISVIIPVKNREKTISDAINSALNQNTNFNYNIIVVNNFSTDNTAQEIEKIASKNKEKVVCITPTDNDLGIGGCWNLAVNNPQCGAIAVQLDSDDIYINNNVLQTIADKFLSDQCAILIGSYQLSDFNLTPIPPYLIDHKEWTPENGHNNALRINGLGAPRCFFTPILRQNPFPNVSYGEDYAIALKLTRTYSLSRIYEPLYICRRWIGNSDNNPSQETLNRNNFYKDFIRTTEILERKKTIEN